VFASIEVWALPLNTFLLVILALANAYIARKQRAEHRDLVDVKRSIGLTRRSYDEPNRVSTREDTGERRRATDNHKD
jgi:hypothetical protein